MWDVVDQLKIENEQISVYDMPSLEEYIVKLQLELVEVKKQNRA